MRRFYFSSQLKGIAILLLLLPLCSFAQSNIAKERVSDHLRWDYSDSQIKISEEHQSVSLILIVKPNTKLKAQEVLYIYPQLVAKDGINRVALDAIAVAGTTRYKVMGRRQALKNSRPSDPTYDYIYTYRAVEKAPLRIEKTLPLQEWMRNADIIIQEESYGCAECELSIAKSIATDITTPLFGEVYYAYDFIQPERVAKKSYETSCDCRVQFQLNQYNIEAGYKNNFKELQALNKFLDESLGTIGAELEGVTIYGYASPEGDTHHNKELSQKRTEALSLRLIARYPQLSEVSRYKTIGMGSDWEGLKNALQEQMQYKSDEIITIIDRYQRDSDRTAAIKALDGGVTYSRLLQEVYPTLRRSTITLQFKIRPYKDDELESVYRTHPDNLNHHELYMLAQQYDKEGKDPTEIYYMAYVIYPNDPISSLNYANALLKYHDDAEQALTVLEKIKKDKRALYPMAISYDLKGDKAKANKLVQEAFDKGSAHARAFIETENR